MSEVRVLLVEDDADIRGALADALVFEGYHVNCAISGEEALPMLRGAPPFDLLLSDVQLPGMEGDSLAIQVASEGLLPPHRIVLMTARQRFTPSLPDVTVIAKPFEVTELVAALRRAFGS